MSCHFLTSHRSRVMLSTLSNTSDCQTIPRYLLRTQMNLTFYVLVSFSFKPELLRFQAFSIQIASPFCLKSPFSEFLSLCADVVVTSDWNQPKDSLSCWNMSSCKRIFDTTERNDMAVVGRPLENGFAFFTRHVYSFTKTRKQNPKKVGGPSCDDGCTDFHTYLTEKRYNGFGYPSSFQASYPDIDD